MVAAPLRALMAVVLVGLALMGSGCSRAGQAPAPATQAPIAVTAPSGRLQEVAPPPLVRQVAERLEERDPQLEILAPADGTLLPAGPWSLKLRLSDWPLADAGPLGLGPHLVVQVDGETVRRLSHPDDLRDLRLPELAPGSHRVTVYAARPWGEAVKAPGASRQIRLHRVAANPQQLPPPGSAQLILASPDGLAEAEPVLIDWLLFDAPLQNLREGDGRWRLRVTVNGDSFLVDRHAPLWLRGLRSGSNALQLELLDGRGEPLNGPFNSLVREVRIQAGPRPGWLRGSLTPLELDQLSGLAPVQPGGRGAGGDSDALGDDVDSGGGQDAKSNQAGRGRGDGVSPGSDGPAPGTPQPSTAPPPQAKPPLNADSQPEGEGGEAPVPSAQPAPASPVRAPGPTGQAPAPSAAPTDGKGRPERTSSARSATEPTNTQPPKPAAANAQPASPEAQAPAALATAQAADAPAAIQAGEKAEDAPTTVAAGETAAADSPSDTTNDQVPDTASQTAQAPAPAASLTPQAVTSSGAPPGAANPADPAPQPARPEAATPPSRATQAAAPQQSGPRASADPRAASPSPVQPTPSGPSEERIAPSTGLAGSARQLVNPDGSLVQPKGSSPLARLRERLQR